MRRLQRLAAALTRMGHSAGDSTAERMGKSLLVTVALMVLPAALLWGALYWFSGEPVAALFPWAYLVASVCCLALFSRNHSYRFLRSAELLLILLIPFLLSVALGGVGPSSGVILWSFLAPAGAIVFDVRRGAWWWFAAFAALLLVSIPLGPAVRATPVALPPDVLLAFTALNIGAVSLISFTLLALFARQREVAQERVEQLLVNVLPPEIAERLQDRRDAIADHFDEASILFADVVDFTPLSDGLRPTEVVGLLDRLFTEFDELVDHYGLEKIKTIGDCYMVAAGVPRPRADHARVLARMALDMRACVGRYARADDGSPLRLRIGINSGPVVAGVIGRRRFLYDLWGDAVNTASRMESYGTPGQIQIARATWQLVREEFVCEELGTVDVKGKGPMETWRLVRPRDASRPHA